MKTAEELLKEKGITPETAHHNYAYVYRVVCDLIGEAQKEGYNQALEDAAEEKTERYANEMYQDENMKRSKMKIRNFLRKIGFERMERNHYANDKCSVNLNDKYISIADNLGNNVIIPVDIYSVVGALIYWGYVDCKDFIEN